MVIITRCPIPPLGGRGYRFRLTNFLIVVQQEVITDWEQEEVVIQVGEDFYWTEFETKIQTKNPHGRSHNSSIVVVYSAMGSTYNYSDTCINQLKQEILQYLSKYFLMKIWLKLG